MTLSEGSMMPTETVSRYLDDVARMLGEADPAYRAEVLAGVRDHLESALGPAPWHESDVQHALARLGPPEEIAAAALEEGAQPSEEAGPAVMARSWVPPIVVTLMAIGLIGQLLLLSSFNVFVPSPSGGETFVSYPEPLSFLWSLPVLLLVPPTPLVLVGALLVTISPLYRKVDRLAAWLALPWCAVVFELGAVVIRATDDCARATTGSCTGVDAGTAQAALGGALAIAGIGVLLVLIRLGRVRAMSRSATWWTASAVSLGMLVSALPIVLLPLTYREGTYVSFGVDGLVAYPWTLRDTLAPVLVVLPVWIVTAVLLVRSPLWTRPAKVIGVALLPVLLAAATAVTAAPSVLTPEVLTAGAAVTIAGAAMVVLTAAALFLSVRRAASEDTVRT